MANYYGTSEDEIIAGGVEDDLILGNGGTDKLIGGGGDDTLVSTGNQLSGLSGNDGDDILQAQKVEFGQFHLFGGNGDDTLKLSVANEKTWGHHSHHAYGGAGADVFSIEDTHLAQTMTLGRLDDFNPDEDAILVDGQVLDFDNLPDNMRIVRYANQQWLQIDDNLLFALEGARMTGKEDGAEITERHFTQFPANLDALPSEELIDQLNYVPTEKYEARLGLLNTEIARAPDPEAIETQVTGTDQADYIYSTRYIVNGKDKFWTDLIEAGDGDDVVDASKGFDTVFGGGGDDIIAGGMDHDLLMGDDGDDEIFGGSENDTIFGGHGDDIVHGGTNADVIYGSAGQDQLFGGWGNDKLVGNSGHDALKGDHGNDTLHGHHGNDSLQGNIGNDKLYGNNGNDRMNGGFGRDALYGGTGNDWLMGGGGHDHLIGGLGNDWLIGGHGNDTLNGGDGTDVLLGRDGDDVIYSEGDLATINGGTGADYIFAGAKEDIIFFNRIGTHNGPAEVDTIENFDADADRLKIFGLNGQNKQATQDFLDNNVIVDGEDMYLDLGDGRGILMTGLIEEEDPTANDADDFLDIFL